MTMLEKLFPASANNDYRGSPTAFYTFILLCIAYTGRSLIHFLKDDSGVNSIASFVLFEGTPDPNSLIYMYSSLWGSQQLVTLLIYWVVALRYRNLLPWMYVTVIAELLLRMVPGPLHGITSIYFEHSPPGSVGNLPMLILALVMFYLSIRHSNDAQGSSD